MGIEVALLALTAVAGVAGTVMQGQAAKKQANASAQIALNDAAYESDAYKQQADKIRRAGKAQIGETNTSLAASGVKLGEGTPLELTKTIIQRSEEDALTSIMQGGRAKSSASAQAKMFGDAGKAAVTNSYVKAAGTVLGAAVDYTRGGFNSVKKEP